MQSLFFMVRDVGMTNDPVAIYRIYRDQKEKARLGIIWPKGDEDVERMTKEFFKPERFLKRLKLLYDYKNRQGQVKHLSLFGFYLQLKKREKLLYLIEWKPVRKQPRQDQSKNESKEEERKNAGELVYLDNRVYSVEEIIEEYENF